MSSTSLLPRLFPAQSEKFLSLKFRRELCLARKPLSEATVAAKAREDQDRDSPKSRDKDAPEALLKLITSRSYFTIPV